MTERTSTRVLLWSHTDADLDTGHLRSGPSVEGDPRPGAVAHLSVDDELVDLDRDAVERLRKACDRLLLADAAAGSADTLHMAQHQQLEAAARRFAEHVDEQATALGRISEKTRVVELDEVVDAASVAALLHLAVVQQQRTVASLGDLLAAVAGE